MIMKRLLLCLAMSLILMMALPTGPALAVNDPFAPAEQCDAPQGEAIGHPASRREQADPASPPFSANNPGQSDGAEGNRSQATAHCANARP